MLKHVVRQSYNKILSNFLVKKAAVVMVGNQVQSTENVIVEFLPHNVRLITGIYRHHEATTTTRL